LAAVALPAASPSQSRTVPPAAPAGTENGASGIDVLAPQFEPAASQSWYSAVVIGIGSGGSDQLTANPPLGAETTVTLRGALGGWLATAKGCDTC
jgi:hypothetical protein